jgi:hypothetical protein
MLIFFSAHIVLYSSETLFNLDWLLSQKCTITPSLSLLYFHAPEFVVTKFQEIARILVEMLALSSSAKKFLYFYGLQYFIPVFPRAGEISSLGLLKSWYNMNRKNVTTPY